MSVQCPPPLHESRWPQPFSTSTGNGNALVGLVAQETLSYDDLWRIHETAQWRISYPRMEPNRVEALVVELGTKLEGLKAQYHELEVKWRAAEDELAAYRAALGSDDK